MDKKLLFIPLGIFLIAIIVVAIIFVPTSQLIVGETILIPTFGHILCDVRPEGEVRLTSATESIGATSKASYICSSALNVYAPRGCDFEVAERPFGVLTKVLDCEIFSNNCNKLSATAPTVHIDYGRRLFVESLVRDTDVVMKAIPFGLRSQEQGFLRITQNCKISSLAQVTETQLIDDKSENEQAYIRDAITNDLVLKVGLVVNYVIGSVPVSDSTNVIIHNGQEVYINKPNSYFPIKVGENGKKYADTRPQSAVQDSSIVCVPSSPFCKEDASGIITDPTGKTCTALGGAIDGWLQDSPNEICKYNCISNSLVKGECKAIPSECPEDKPLWDSLKGECVSGELPPTRDKCKWFEQPFEKEECGFWCSLGLKNPTQISGCKTAGWIYLIITGIIIIILAIIVTVGLTLLLRKRGKK